MVRISVCRKNESVRTKIQTRILVIRDECLLRKRLLAGSNERRSILDPFLFGILSRIRVLWIQLNPFITLFNANGNFRRERSQSAFKRAVINKLLQCSLAVCLNHGSTNLAALELQNGLAVDCEVRNPDVMNRKRRQSA